MATPPLTTSLPSTWAGLDLRQLTALRVIAHEGSFRLAARRLGYTRSAVSHQVAALERIIGHRALERSRGSRLTLTEVGRVLLGLADSVESAVEVAHADVDAVLYREARLLRLGLEFGLPHLAWAVASMRARHADVAVEVHAGLQQDDCLHLLDLNRLDLALVSLPVSRLGLKTREVARSAYVAALPAGSPLRSATGPIALADLAGRTVIALSRDASCAAQKGCAPAVVVSDVDLALALVRKGTGTALLPDLAIAPDDPDVTIRPLRDGFPPLRLAACFSAAREAPGHVSEFLRDLEAVIRRTSVETPPHAVAS